METYRPKGRRKAVRKVRTFSQLDRWVKLSAGPFHRCRHFDQCERLYLSVCGRRASCLYGHGARVRHASLVRVAGVCVQHASWTLVRLAASCAAFAAVAFAVDSALPLVPAPAAGREQWGFAAPLPGHAQGCCSYPFLAYSQASRTLASSA